MKIRKGDVVKVITGKDKGKTGKVLMVDTETLKVLVEHVNTVKHHQKPSQKYRQGGIIEKEMPIHISNVMYFDAKANQASKLGAKITANKKARYIKKSKEVITEVAPK